MIVREYYSAPQTTTLHKPRHSPHATTIHKPRQQATTTCHDSDHDSDSDDGNDDDNDDSDDDSAMVCVDQWLAMVCVGHIEARLATWSPRAGPPRIAIFTFVASMQFVFVWMSPNVCTAVVAFLGLRSCSRVPASKWPGAHL